MSIAIKLNKYLRSFFKLDLKEADKELYDSINSEFLRQQFHIELIALKILFLAVLEAQGSVLIISMQRVILVRDITVDVNT